MANTVPVIVGLLISAVGVFGIDRAISHIARRRLPSTEAKGRRQAFGFRLVFNTHAPAAALSRPALAALSLAMAAALATLLVLSPSEREWLAGVGAGLAIGGAAGNMIDVLRFGGTIDYLVIGGIVVNLADVAITFGLAALMAAVLL